MSPSSLYRSFVVLCLVSLVLWWHTLVATFGLALRANEYTHTLVIIPLSIALILTEWRSRKAKPETESPYRFSPIVSSYSDWLYRGPVAGAG